MKKLLFLLLAFMATVAVNAEQVSRQQALQKAKQFMPGKQFGEAKSFARAGSPTDQEPFYIFNTKGKKGFVIVSGDDRTEPILGYSDRGEISVENMPENLKYWLECYEVQMKTLDQANSAGARGVTRSASRAAVAPLIQTKWDQDEPYNLMCPDGSYVDYDELGYNSANRCLTGCVATAMAQVMYYHQWPQSCGAIDSYDIYKRVNMGTEEVPNWQRVIDHSFHGLPETDFKWGDMTLTYSSDATGASANAVAELMRYCGQAVNMNYGLSKNGGSSAGVSAWDMATYFNYSKKAKSVYRMFYSVADWEELIYQELANNRPVLYGGSSATGGHEFICDGYDGNGLFHFNWGWSGGSDGFFVLSLANPQELGSGGGTNTDGYSYIQDAVIGLMKPAEGEVESPTIYGLIADDESWTTEYSRQSVTENFTDVSLPRLIFMEYSYYGNNEVWPDYALDYAWGLYQDGALADVYGTASTTLTDGDGNWRQDVAIVDLGAGWADGTYMLRQVYRPQGSETWIPCEMLDGDCNNLAVSYIKATVSGNTLTLSKANEDYLSSDITVNNVNFSPSSIEKGRAVEVTVNLTNNGDAFQELICLWLDNNMTTLVCGSVEPGKTGNVKLHFVPKTEGVISYRITTDEYGNNVIWEGSITVEAPKPQSLSGTMTIDGFDTNSRVLSGNKLRVRAQVTNNGTNTYDNQIALILYQLIPGTNQGSPFASKSVPATIQPGETKEVVLTVPDLNFEEKYFFYLYYYSGGFRQKMEVNGTGGTFSLAPLSSVQGDADGNGVVDAKDVKTVADYIMGRDPIPFVFANANMNGDTKVDAADLVKLINMTKTK